MVNKKIIRKTIPSKVKGKKLPVNVRKPEQNMTITNDLMNPSTQDMINMDAVFGEQISPNDTSVTNPLKHKRRR